jgi:outer membrane autotransporter protein
VALSGSVKKTDTALFKPFADFTVMPAAGGRNVTNRFGLADGSASDAITTRITNNALVQGKLGVNAAVKNHSVSLSYGLGGGSDGRVDQELHAFYRYSF